MKTLLAVLAFLQPLAVLGQGIAIRSDGGFGTNTHIQNVYVTGTNGVSFDTNGNNKLYYPSTNTVDLNVGTVQVLSTTPNYADFKVPLTFLGKAPGYLANDQNWDGINTFNGPILGNGTNVQTGPQTMTGSNYFGAELVTAGGRIEPMTNSPNIYWSLAGNTFSTNANFTSIQIGSPIIGKLYSMRVTNSSASPITNTLPFAALSLSASNGVVTSVRIPANQVAEYSFRVNGDGSIRISVAGADNAALVNLLNTGLTNFQSGATLVNLSISNQYAYNTLQALREAQLYGTTTSHPTNILAGPGTVSGAANSLIFTTTNGGFSVLRIGDSFTPNSLTNAQGTEQHTVVAIAGDNNSLRVVRNTTGTAFTNVVWTYSPAAHRLNDNNDHYASVLDSGGNFLMTDYAGGGTGGGFTWSGNGGTNNWVMGLPTVSGSGTDGRLRIRSSVDGSTFFPSIITLYPHTANIDDAFSILGNGVVSNKFGLVVGTGSGQKVSITNGSITVGNSLIPTNGMFVPQKALTIGGTGSTNISLSLSTNYGGTYFVVLTTNAYFTQPAGLVAGAPFYVHIQQGTNFTVGFDTNYWRFPGGFISAATTNANAFDVLSCVVGPYATNVFVVQAQNFK